ncbi:unnamed protein product, partial [Ectocarpus sp. 4 AP-2014]
MPICRRDWLISSLLLMRTREHRSIKNTPHPNRSPQRHVFRAFVRNIIPLEYDRLPSARSRSRSVSFAGRLHLYLPFFYLTWACLLAWGSGCRNQQAETRESWAYKRRAT